MKPWLCLALAACCEVGWAVALKHSEGLSLWRPAVLALLLLLCSLGLLALATRTLPLGTAYAFWAGLGVIGAVLWGMCCLAEPVTWGRLAGMALVALGLVAIKVG